MLLWNIFAALPRPSAAGSYTIQGGTAHFCVGRTYDDHPAILIEFANTQSTSIVRRLANIAYSPPGWVDIIQNDGIQRRARLAVLECRTKDESLAKYFFRMAQALLLDDPSCKTEQGLELAIDTLVILFRTLERPGAKTIQGLWAELAIILWAANPTAAMSSWHSSPRALHDFAAGSNRLEVKSSRTDLREHTFLLEQLLAVHYGTTLIASILLKECDDGMSVFDLVEAIASRVLQGSAARLETIVAESLGNTWREAVDTRFSLAGAQTTRRFFLAETIPSIPQPLPPEIKSVRFTVDLSGLEHLDLSTARARGDLFAKLLPPVE